MKIKRTLHENQYTFLIYVAHFFLQREKFRKKIVGEIKANILSHNFFFENRAACEIMWKNIMEPDRSPMKIWPTRNA
jgi:hypothetical protein